MCLCGSIRYRDEFERAAEGETLEGRIVLTLGVQSSNDELSAEQLALLRRLHQHRIDLADEVLIINPGGHIGESTTEEIEYARSQGKPVRWLLDSAVPSR